MLGLVAPSTLLDSRQHCFTDPAMLLALPASAATSVGQLLPAATASTLFPFLNRGVNLNGIGIGHQSFPITSDPHDEHHNKFRENGTPPTAEKDRQQQRTGGGFGIDALLLNGGDQQQQQNSAELNRLTETAKERRDANICRTPSSAAAFGQYNGNGGAFSS